MLDPGYPSRPSSCDREIGPAGDAPRTVATNTLQPTDHKRLERAVNDSRRLSSLRQTIRRWDNRAKAKGYDTILECLEAAPVKNHG